MDFGECREWQLPEPPKWKKRKRDKSPLSSRGSSSLVSHLISRSTPRDAVVDAGEDAEDEAEHFAAMRQKALRKQRPTNLAFICCNYNAADRDCIRTREEANQGLKNPAIVN